MLKPTKATSALLVAVAAAVGFAAGPATSSASATSSQYSLATQTLPDGNKVIARWNPCQTITYRVNAGLAGNTRARRLAAINDVKRAFGRASAVSGMNFRYAGTTTQIPTNTSSNAWYARQTSAEIVVAWANQTVKGKKSNLLGRSSRGGYVAGTGGYAFKYWKAGSAPWTGVSGRGFVVLNAAQNSKFRPGFGSGSTRGELLMHEIGHAVGLNHVSSTSQVMYPTILSRSTAAYSAGDRLGLQRLGAANSCIATPSFVWNDLS